MPYKKYARRNYNRRSRRRRPYRPWYKKKYSAMEIAGKAWSAAKYLKGLINVEFKKFDRSVSTTTSGNVTCLSEIAQGDTDQTRDGLSILAKSLYVRGTVTGSASAGNTRVRIILFKDNQQIADTAPAQSDILDPDSTDQILAPLNNKNVGRFKILKDYMMSMNQVLGSTEYVRSFKLYLPMQQHIRWNGANATDLQKNHIYCLLVHDQTALLVPSFDYESRLTYVDN